MKINLLPWRQERDRQRKQQFSQALALMALVGVMIAAGYWQWRQGTIDTQQARNQYLNQQIAELDRKAGELNKLKEERQKLLDRIEVIKALQQERPQTVRLFSNVVTAMPEQVYLQSLERAQALVSMKGQAESNHEVSRLLRNLDSAEYLATPNLSRVSRVKEGGSGWMEFDLSVTLRPPKPAGEQDGSTQQ
ncbi:PilN domain-containing protein [Balneatrix alpica]|uniref:PilN domain-containing protein n=1 Tax=Balneatrix alpica TaxID=75684 RepID=A0ABV5ZAV3_9GAMM|nr:PilN domain-containing protein [Balneatrix alpica]